MQVQILIVVENKCINIILVLIRHVDLKKCIS